MAEQKEEIKFLGINFNKIKGEKDPTFQGNIDMGSNIEVKNVEKFKPALAKQESLKIDFVFDIDYKEMGKVSLEGTLFLLLDTKTMKEILDSWKKQTLPDFINLAIANIVVQKASTKALQLEEELGLPSHIPFPRLRPQAQPESK